MNDKDSLRRLRDASIDGFPLVVTLPVLWGDQDMFGHVNNIIHLKWFESSRVAYWEQSGLVETMGTLGLRPILARAACDYLMQITYPQTIHVAARVARIGRTSWTMHHAIFTEMKREIAAVGESVVVLFDYARQESRSLTDEMREDYELAAMNLHPEQRPD